MAAKEEKPSFGEQLEEITRDLDSTLNQCLHDYNLDEMRHLYDVIEADHTFQNSASGEKIGRKGIAEKSKVSLNQDI